MVTVRREIRVGVHMEGLANQSALCVNVGSEKRDREDKERGKRKLLDAS